MSEEGKRESLEKAEECSERDVGSENVGEDKKGRATEEVRWDGKKEVEEEGEDFLWDVCEDSNAEDVRFELFFGGLWINKCVRVQFLSRLRVTELLQSFFAYSVFQV